MRKKSLLFGIVLIIVGFIIIFSGGPSSHNQPSEGIVDGANIKKEEQFDKVPTFSLLDYEGNEVSSEDFEGKILVINSWATWCPFCVKELSEFGKLQEEFKDEIVVIAINRSESITKSKNYIDDLGLTNDLIFLLDSKDSFYSSIGGFSMPETLFVDTDKNIIVHKRGPIDFQGMKKIIEEIISN